MSVGEYCNREVVIVNQQASVVEAAQLMRRFHVGNLVVVDQSTDKTIPIGILTDRDIVIELVANEVSLSSVSIGDVMSFALVTVHEDDDLMEIIKLMRDNGVRRVPVTNRAEELVGILAVDDVIEIITEQLSDLVTLFAREHKHEEETRK